MIIPGFPTPFIAGSALISLDINASGTVDIQVADNSGTYGVRRGYYGSISSNTLLTVNGSIQKVERVVTYNPGTATARNHVIIDIDDPAWGAEIVAYLNANVTSFQDNGGGSVYYTPISWWAVSGGIYATSFSGLPHTGFKAINIGNTYTMEFA